MTILLRSCFTQTWMCGGRILIHPCSHIGHVSRDRDVYNRESVWKNVARTAEVWFYGKYKQLFRNRLNTAYLVVSKIYDYYTQSF